VRRCACAVGRRGCDHADAVADLDAPAVSALFADAARIFEADPDNPVRYRQVG